MGSIARTPVIAVAFYSTYGHVAALAEQVIEGVKASGATVKVYQFQETLPEEVLTKMYAGSSLKPKYPIIQPDDLKEVDGLIIGAPTRYGRVPAQVSQFFDATGGLWKTGALVGKFVTMFSSVAGQHSGHETTFTSTFPYFAHQGMVYVPIGYADPSIGEITEMRGGSPYGATTIASADGSLMPTTNDLSVAKFQGKYFSDFVATFVRGKHLQASQSAAAPVEGVKEQQFTTGDVAAKEVPQPYDLGAPVVTSGTKTEATPTATAPDTAVGTPAEAPTPTEQTAQKPVQEKTTTATATQPKKSRGFFASCCGDQGIDK